ncbi:MAG: hypothetical protein WBE51_10855 [Xanthobacteraceae bacterium]|jgi:hypothetical protein
MISTDSKITINDAERADSQAGKAAGHVARRRARLVIGGAQVAQAR